MNSVDRAILLLLSSVTAVEDHTPHCQLGPCPIQEALANHAVQAVIAAVHCFGVDMREVFGDELEHEHAGNLIADIIGGVSEALRSPSITTTVTLTRVVLINAVQQVLDPEQRHDPLEN